MIVLKKLIIVITILSAFSANCQIELSTQELTRKLCKKWRINHNSVKGEILPQQPNLRNFYIEFFPDFTYLNSNNGVITKGSWCYNIENRNIEITLRGENTLRVVSLIDDQLIMILVNDFKKNMTKLPHTYTSFVSK